LDGAGLLRRLAVFATVAGISLALIFGASVRASAATDGCSERERQAGTCPTVNGTTDGNKVDLNATQDGDDSSSSGNNGSGSDDTPDTPTGIADHPDFGSVLLHPTLSDLISFRPTPGVDHMEPNGWFIQGLDANFYSTGGSSVQSGTLLGFPARVRFTPVAWTWDYGDGKTATRSTQGGTWRAQHIREFDPTTTSHVYTKRGTYWIDLTLTYRAEFTFGTSGWATIDGYLHLPANRLRATVGDAKTVLFNENCQQNPSGAGC
jgi:hypothetical protein